MTLLTGDRSPILDSRLSLGELLGESLHRSMGFRYLVVSIGLWPIEKEHPVQVTLEVPVVEVPARRVQSVGVGVPVVIPALKLLSQLR